MTRAMILAAGLGTRLRPLTEIRAKPALPVCGIPVIAYLLELLHHHDINDVIVNLHHLPNSVRDAVEEFKPSGLTVSYCEEATPLGTGGGIRGAREFLMESDPCLVMAGDMLLDLDLTALIKRHRSRQDLATLVLREDSRAGRFGSIGIDEGGAVRRIAESFDLGNEHAAGVFLGVRVFSRRALETLPDRENFEDLRDWLVPILSEGKKTITAELLPQDQCTWEPVGTPDEYLRANFQPPTLPFFDPIQEAQKRGVTLTDDVVIGAGATIESGAQLSHCIIWDGETVPRDTKAEDGVFANDQFHSCKERS
ncbi:MAG: mannose-1-phosphate guanylyltransferase [Myxococcota bacterium]|jgi:mannose-1-phosphate guanylyltransferase